jgi:hypothetical protein
MSETKHTPLPLPREVGGHVWLIELPAFDRSPHGQPITIADKAMAFDLVNRYNAGPKVEELLQIIRTGLPHYPECRQDLSPFECSCAYKNVSAKAREVEAALKVAP